MPFAKSRGRSRLVAPSINWDDPLARGLLYAFPFNEGVGSIGCNATGRPAATVVGSTSGTWTTGPSINPSTPNNYVNTNITYLGFAAGTLLWWQNPSVLNNSTARVTFSQTNSGPTADFGAQVYSDNNWYIGWNGATDTRIILPASATNAPQGKWSMYACVWAPTGTWFYMNGGILLGTNATPPLNALFGINAIYGASGSPIAGFAGAFAGKLGELRIYQRALGRAEIAQTYAEPWRPYLQSRRRLIATVPTGFPVSITETGAVADTFSVTVTGRSVAIAEAGAATDTLSQTTSSAGAAAITEIGAALDTATLTSTRFIGLAETGIAADAALTTSILRANVAEIGVAIDTLATGAPPVININTAIIIA